MKRLLLILITLITLINVTFASFPIENELNEVSNQFNFNEVLLFIFGIGFLASIAFLIYWGIKKILSREMKSKKKVSVIVALLLGVLVIVSLRMMGNSNYIT